MYAIYFVENKCDGKFFGNGQYVNLHAGLTGFLGATGLSHAPGHDAAS